MTKGFNLTYRTGENQRCPCCQRQQWHIGRTMAECAFCEMALPLADQARQPAEPRFTVFKSGTADFAYRASEGNAERLRNGFRPGELQLVVAG